MSDYVEQALITTASEAEKFRLLCQEVFANDAGRKLLALLVKARHPMGPRFNLNSPDPIPAAFRDGQADVVSLLWRYGSDTKAVPPISSHDKE